MSDWIPVSERLPEAGKTVLLAFPWRIFVCGRVMGPEDKHWDVETSDLSFPISETIAWMPLPKHPEER